MEINRYEFTVGAQGESVKLTIPFSLAEEFIKSNSSATLKNMMREFAQELADQFTEDLLSVYKPDYVPEPPKVY